MAQITEIAQQMDIDVAQKEGKYLTFALGHEEYGLEMTLSQLSGWRIMVPAESAGTM